MLPYQYMRYYLKETKSKSLQKLTKINLGLLLWYVHLRKSATSFVVFASHPANVCLTCKGTYGCGGFKRW